MSQPVLPLGRRVPSDFDHVGKFPLSAVMAYPPVIVEKVLKLPTWHWTHDQGAEGSCVGHGTAMERAITNTAQNIFARLAGIKTRRYDPIDIWNEAKLRDEWPDTNPGDDNGTSVRAAYDVMRLRGPIRVRSMKVVNGVPTPQGYTGHRPLLEDGAIVNRWATKVDEMRGAIAGGVPVTIGVNWYSAFDSPEQVGDDHWIARTGSLGSVRGGHCVCVYGASDRRQAFRVKNSWGRAFPLVWVPYTVMARLLAEDGEATLITDR